MNIAKMNIPEGECRIQSIVIGGYDLLSMCPLVLEPGQKLVISCEAGGEVHVLMETERTPESTQP